MILPHLEIQFSNPEEVIIAQGDEIFPDSFMYFIEKGQCAVSVKDKHKLRNQEKPVRLLGGGRNFGEIGAIYKQRRTCTVTSTTFTTLGRISIEKLNDVFVKYPHYKDILVESMKDYDDVLKLFFEKALGNIDYMQGLKQETINEVIFSLLPQYQEKNSFLFKENEIATKMYVIQNGMVEIYITMDNGVDLVIERLYRGSVINHKSFLVEDCININARCATPVSVYYITLSKINEIRRKDELLDSCILAIEEELIHKDNAIGLDYIINKKRTRELNVSVNHGSNA